MINAPGIPSTRWFDAAMMPKEQVAQKDNLKAMMIMGHGGNTVTRMPEVDQGHGEDRAAGRGRSASDHLGGALRAQERHISAADLHPVRMLRARARPPTAPSSGASRSSKPIFESKNDYEVMYLLAKKLGFADLMFKNIKVENNVPVAEDILREINRGGFSTGYCGQSPERLKVHMANQKDFDLVSLRAKDGPAKGDYYGLPWPCWGTPELKHPGTHTLYNTNLHVMDGGGTFRARFGVERVIKTKVMENGQSRSRRRSKHNLARRRLLFARIRNQGRLSGIHSRRAEEARLGHGSYGSRNGGDPEDQSRQSGRGRLVDRPVGRHPARGDEARLYPLRQRQGARQCVRPAGCDPCASRADLHAAAGARRQIPDAAECAAIPLPNIGFDCPEGCGRQGHCQAIPAGSHLGPSCRI